MAKGNQPPADDITLRDVINHMNHNFTSIKQEMVQSFQTVRQDFAEAKRERAEILSRVEAEASAADDTLEKVVALTERVGTALGFVRPEISIARYAINDSHQM